MLCSRAVCFVWCLHKPHAGSRRHLAPCTKTSANVLPCSGADPQRQGLCVCVCVCVCIVFICTYNCLYMQQHSMRACMYIETCYRPLVRTENTESLQVNRHVIVRWSIQRIQDLFKSYLQIQILNACMHTYIHTYIVVQSIHTYTVFQSIHTYTVFQSKRFRRKH